MKLPSIIRMDFKLSNLMHSALVSISGDTGEMFVHVQLINSFFKKISGVEHIRFITYENEIMLKDVNHPFIYELAKMVAGMVKTKIKDPATNPLRAI